QCLIGGIERYVEENRLGIRRGHVPHFASSRLLDEAPRLDAEIRFTEPEMRWILRLAAATADFARRSSARPTLTAAKISEALAFFNDTFACRRVGTLIVFVV